MSSRKLKFIDLFAGIGGFRLALENFRTDCVFSSEWDKHCQEVYLQNFGDRPAGDITKIPAASIPNHDILCGGFPCQAFSVSGKRLGFQDTRGTLFFDIARIVKHHRPKVVLLENVKNLKTHQNGETMKTIETVFSDLGYSVFSKVLRSSDFGVPQARERIFIVAIEGRVSSFNWPQACSELSIIDDVLLDLSNSEFKDLQIVRDDIRFYKHERDVLDPRKPFQIGLLNKGCQGERIYSRYASGITLSAYGGGAAAKTGAYLVDRGVRKLHPVEGLRLQGFPDDHKLLNSKVTSYRQLGNSVSVPVVQAVFKAIYEQVFLQQTSRPGLESAA